MDLLWGGTLGWKPEYLQKAVAHVFCEPTRNNDVNNGPRNFSRSSSREVRIRVPTFFWTSILAGEPSPKKDTVKGQYWGT